ncbi:MAG: hypothetical protein A2Y23_15505 [Clostridiales bacterium GWB2_37_7]|nr:MAG: hypothetical protein A2Y23_15505 [Clostridiales bacterium GWB2_37_7]
MMKRVISLILIISVMLTTAPTLLGDTTSVMKDLEIDGKAHWAKDYIDKLIDKLIIAGYPDGTFKPNNPVEVDAYIKMVVAALGNNFENGKDYWATPFINKAIELKLIDSNEFNTYRRVITREEAAKVIVQALATLEQLPSEEEINKYKSVVPDYAKISVQYKQHALIAYATGMITGDPKGNFNPTDNLSRAEAATVIMRLLDKSLRKPIAVQEEEETAVLPELLKSDEEVWGQENIGEMTSLREYQVKNGKLYFSYKDYYEDVLAKENLNPNINQQLHDLVKVLISESHYVKAFYSSESAPDLYGYKTPSSAVVAYSKDEGYAENDVSFFNYIFLDNRPTENGQQIRLKLNNLWWYYKEDGSLWDISDGWVDLMYAEKLMKSVIAIFGQEHGTEIYQYIYNIYIDERTKQDSQVRRDRTKTIGNVKVDFNNDGSALYFYFTIK